MKTFTGKVVSLANEKTALVEVERNWKHPLYKKIVRRTKNHPSHVEGLELKIGDTVVIQECRPLSKTKHFKVVEVVSQEEEQKS